MKVNGREITLCLTILFITFSMLSSAQQWEAMDYGIKHENTNTAGVYDIEIDPINGDIYVGGTPVRNNFMKVRKSA